MARTKDTSRKSTDGIAPKKRIALEHVFRSCPETSKPGPTAAGHCRLSSVKSSDPAHKLAFETIISQVAKVCSGYVSVLASVIFQPQAAVLWHCRAKVWTSPEAWPQSSGVELTHGYFKYSERPVRWPVKLGGAMWQPRT